MRTIPTPPEIVFHPGRFGAFCLAALVLVLAGNLRAQPVRPTITVQPQSQTVAAGRDVTFSVAASGTLPMNYSWRLNGTVKTNITLNSNTCVFTIQNVQTNQAGGWRVGITNIAGPASGGLSSNAQLTVIVPVLAQFAGLDAEGCAPANAAIDPGETVTIALSLTNTSSLIPANLVATLEETGGVISPSSSQSYGSLISAGPAVTRSFTFTANGACGGSLTATLHLLDGTNDFGRVRFPLPLGVMTPEGPRCCTANLADLALGISSPTNPVALGSNISWTITVTNRGPEPATGVVISNPLPAELIFLSATPSQGGCATQSGAIVCALGSLASNATVTIAITTTVDSIGSGSVTNRAQISSQQSDPNAGNNTVLTSLGLIAPSISISSVSSAESSAATNDAMFQADLSFAIQRPVTVAYVTSNGTAVAGSDYAFQSGTLVFPPGTTSQSVAVPIVDDFSPEPAESFFVLLSDAVHARIDRGRGVGTIIDDEPQPFANTASNVWTTTLSSNASVVAMTLDTDGNILLAGTIGVAPNIDYATTKVGPGGDILWQGRYSSPGNANDFPEALSVDHDGSVYVTGSSGIVKYDASGNLLWTARTNSGVAIAVDSHGGVIVTGNGGAANNLDYVTVKYNRDGTVAWLARYNGPRNANDTPVALAVDRDDNIIVTGNSFQSATNSDFATVKYDADGNQIWVVRYDGFVGQSSSLDETVRALTVDNGGNVYVTGQSPNCSYGFCGDFVTLKYNADGTMMWAARYNGSEDGDDNPRAIAVDPAGNVYVSGESGDDEDYFPARTVKYDAEGRELWVARLDQYDFFFRSAMTLDQSGNIYVVAGRTASKLDPEGRQLWLVSVSNSAALASIAVDGSGSFYVARDQFLMRFAQSEIVGVPTLISQPAGQVVFGNTTPTLQAGVSGLEPLRYQWRFNGYPLRPPATNSSLTLSNATLRRGDYSILITNAVGRTRSREAPLIILPDPTSQIGLSGGNLALSVETEGAPTSGYQWQRFGVDLPGATNATLVLTNTQPTDTADYTVTLRTSGGVFTSAVARVSVHSQVQQAWSASYNSSVSGYDSASALALDATGNLYVSGTTQTGSSENFTTIKYGPDGTRLWTALYQIPSCCADSVKTVAVDATGNVYVAGTTATDYIVLKYDGNGHQLWVALYNSPTNGNDQVAALAVDSSGNAFVTGSAGTIKYAPNGSRIWTTTINGLGLAVDAAGNAHVAEAARVAKYSANGSLLWSRTNFFVASLALDAAGNVFVLGAGTAKYDANGSLLWSSPLSGTRFAVDSGGNVLVAANTGTDPMRDVVIAKLDPDGSLDWVTRFNGPANLYDYPSAIAADGAGNLYIAIRTGHLCQYSCGDDEICYFVCGYNVTAKFDPDGNMVWAVPFIGAGTYNVTDNSLVLDGSGQVYVAGVVSGGDYSSGDFLAIKYEQTVVPGAPTITSQPQPQSRTTIAGSAVSIQATAQGIEPLRYQWRFYGSNIAGATNPILTLANVQPANSGGYSVEVVNAAGVIVSREATLMVTSVVVPVTVTVLPSSQWNVLGSEVILSVPATGTGPFSYQWQLNGTNLPGGTNATFIVTNLDSSRAGEYAAIVGNSVSSVTSGVARVSVSSQVRQVWVAREDSSGQWAPGNAVAPDLEGNVYVTGGVGTIKYNSVGGLVWRMTNHSGIGLKLDNVSGDILVAGAPPYTGFDQGTLAMMLHSGGSVVWSTRNPNAGAYAMTADPSGRLFASGGAFGTTMKFSETGALLWTVTFASSGNAYPHDIAVDPAGNVYVTGSTGNADAFTVKYDVNGNQLWARFYYRQGTAFSGGNTLAVDASGNIYVAGNFDDAKVIKYDANGGVLWVSRNTAPGGANALLLAADGSIYTTGGSGLVKHDASGNELWIAGGLAGQALMIDRAGGLLVTGSVQDRGLHFATAKYDTNGNRLWLARYRTPGGYSYDYGTAVAVSSDSGAAIYVTGTGDGDCITLKYVEQSVPGMPEISTPPQAMTCIRGDAAILTVAASGAGPLQFQWRMNGTNVAGATNSTLELTNVQFSQAGSYTVEVFNSLGLVLSRDARLTVLVPLTIDAQPQSQEVLPGSSVAFNVIASGTLPLRFQWQFNGAPLAGATNALLLLNNIQPAHAGNYAAVVSNVVGVVTSHVAQLTLLLPPAVTNSLAVTNVLAGAEVIMSVTVEGTMPFRYQWRKNGVNIPGATNATYVILNAKTSDGGAYTIAVANRAGATTSDPTLLTVTFMPTPPGDNFAQRVLIAGTNGLVTGTNRFATKEPGEPDHGRKPGGKSVWYTWQAPTNGIATFRTAGSVFDTLLGVYTGTNVAALTTVDTDEDRGGFLTSEARFNAVAGTEYAIAIDGFAGVSGDFALSWELEQTADTIPVITQQPLGRTLSLGANTVFGVTVDGQQLSYQWYLNGTALPGATTPDLVRNNVRAVDVGFYAVRVRNAFGREVESLPAALEIVGLPKPLSVDKLEDLLNSPLPGGGGFAPASLPSGFVAVSLGTIDYQIINNVSNTTQLHEPNQCGTIGGATRWIGLRPTSDGMFSIDTLGSAIDTVLTVYRETNLLYLASGLIDCDNDSGTDGKRSLIRFQATRNVNYLVVVDGVNYERGVININWAFGQPPPTSSPTPERRTVRPGEALVLRATSTNGVPPPRYQWRWNGKTLVGATNDFLWLGNLQGANGGQYSVVVSNALGVVTNTADVMVEVPYLTAEPRSADGIYRLHLPPITNQTVVLEVSTDLQNWIPFYLHPAPAPSPYLDLPATNHLFQFFRARPW